MAHKYGSLFNIKEFKDEVDKNYKGVALSKKDLYDIALKIYIKKISSGDSIDRRQLRSDLKDLSEDLFGDRFFFEAKVSEETNHMNEKYILKCSVSSGVVYKAINCHLLNTAFTKFQVKDDIEAYDTAKSVLFNMLCGDYKFSDDIERQKTYFKVRSIVQHYASALEGDRDAWKKDYEAFLKDKVITIRKAARGGKYEEIQLTASEVLDMKRRDEQLEDVDEDL